MSQPKVTINELDGALGVLPAGTKIHAVIGPSTQGPLDTPAAFAREADVVTNFGAGPLVEYATAYIRRTGRPILVTRSASSVAGSFEAASEADDTTGTSAVTTSGTPNDDYEFYFEVVDDGTIGTAGITFRWSLDGGRTLSAVTALGTANSFVVPGSGITIDFGVGTLTGGTYAITTLAPNWSAADLTEPLFALAQTSLAWREVYIAGRATAAAFSAVASFMASMLELKPRAALMSFRMREADETRTDYLTAFDAAFGGEASTFVGVTYGAGEVVSAPTGRQYRRPAGFAIAPHLAVLQEHQDGADVNLGNLPIRITDANGNPKYHDESVFPGPAASRAMTLRTWPTGPQGVYVNNPFLLSPTGSDFQFVQHRLVMNLAHEALRAYFTRRLSVPVLVDRDTGFILEEEAQEIEAGAVRAMEALIMDAPKASAVNFTLSRTDNLLSTSRMTGQARIIPLAYPKEIVVDLGFENPALQAQAA
jgi:hypothetical protein